MANIIRNAKSGSDWSDNELTAYNIRVVEQPFADFFAVNELPPVPASLHSFATKNRSEISDGPMSDLLHYLELAHSSGKEAAVDVFAQHFLNHLGYIKDGRLIMIKQELPLFICGLRRFAKTDISILDKRDIVLLVQENKRFGSRFDPEPQLIAEAIATYQRNNLTRVRDLGVPELDTMVIPGITLQGTFPIFYKITITASLNDAVKTGTFPEVATTVYRHTPRPPRCNSEGNQGMMPLDNCPILLQYFEAFKGFVSAF